MPSRQAPSRERLRELARRPQENPVWYIRRAFGNELWEKQQEIVRSVWKNRYTSVRSCHASGKTYTAGQVSISFLHAFPHSIVISTAPTARQVEDMLWKEINVSYQQARRIWDIPGRMLKTSYELAADWYAVGLSTDDPNRFQGYHAKHILIIIDESSGVPPAIFEAIEGVGSTGNVHILELGNPTDPTGHFASTFTDPFYEKIHISCFDTPNFTRWRSLRPDGSFDEGASCEALLASSEGERIAALTHPYLIAPEWVYQRLVRWGGDSPMFQSRCLGNFPLEGDDTLIPLRHILRCQDPSQVDTYGVEEVLGVDVARYGTDQTVFAYRKGNRVEQVLQFRKQDTMETVSKIVRFRIDHPWCKIHVDDTGVGGGVTDRLRELDLDAVAAINVGEAAYDKEQFKNKRAEFYWALRERFEGGDILIPKDDRDLDLSDQLSKMKVKYLSNGQIQIESKDDMRKRGIHSPDAADAVMLAFAPTHIGSFGQDAPEEDPDGPPPPSPMAGLLGKVY